MRFYASLFEGAEIHDVMRHPDGTIAKASITLAGQTIFCSDSPIEHAFDFTPSSSLFVACESEEELRRLASALGAKELMPVNNYGFSRLFRVGE
jgi:predicted 3-demethylubiquinone-9 3-methyltransferase (glyoxalase superfamily)